MIVIQYMVEDQDRGTGVHREALGRKQKGVIAGIPK